MNDSDLLTLGGVYEVRNQLKRSPAQISVVPPIFAVAKCGILLPLVWFFVVFFFDKARPQDVDRMPFKILNLSLRRAERN